MSYIRRDRYDLTTLVYREPAKLSPCVRFLLIAGTSLLLWIAAVRAIGVIL